MNQDPIITTCPIWGTDCKKLPPTGDGDTFFSDRAGGRYYMSGSAQAVIRQWDENRSGQKAALSQAILEANLNGAVPRFTSEDIQENASVLKSRRIKEAYQLFVRAADSLTKIMGAPFIDLGDGGNEIPFELLIASGWNRVSVDDDTHDFVKQFIKFGEDTGHFATTGMGTSITFDGVMFLEDIGLDTRNSKSIFVAMWFGDSQTTNFYETVVKPAIEGAGYNCVRIDETHHNERIDEQILAEIRNSIAVLVDVTCGLAKPEDWSKSLQVGAPRGGVYFEAGYAAGLKKPIIWTVKHDVADVENVVHFDVRQFNQLRWGKNGTHEDKLTLQARIIATLGRGDIL